jgi:hypothetical protein
MFWRLLHALSASISFHARLLPFIFAVHGALNETTMLLASFGALADIVCSISIVSSPVPVC